MIFYLPDVSLQAIRSGYVGSYKASCDIQVAKNHKFNQDVLKIHMS